MSISDPESKESHECPECGRAGFDSAKSMKIHYGLTHDGSIAGNPVQCAGCDSTFRVPDWRFEQFSNHYCSNECKQTSAKVSCHWCGEAFEILPSRAQRDTEKFCSSDCVNRWRKSQTGKKSPAYKSVSVECEVCEKEFKRQPSNISDHNFCSHECYGEYRSEEYTGKNNPSWKPPGECVTRSYGPSWHKQRQKARARDGGECVICGADDLVDVHHIRPFREFGVENHEQANDLDNLVCLCRSHHSKWEGVPLRPEVVAE